MNKKRKRARRRRERPLPSGVCHVCGCTDEHGCDAGCTWVDKDCTICSECDKWAHRASAKGADSPSEIPVYGLWVVDGGPRGRGHWLVETDDGERLFPAVYFDRLEAGVAALAEQKQGIDVVVVQLMACDGSKR